MQNRRNRAIRSAKSTPSVVPVIRLCLPSHPLCSLLTLSLILVWPAFVAKCIICTHALLRRAILNCPIGDFLGLGMICRAPGRMTKRRKQGEVWWFDRAMHGSLLSSYQFESISRIAISRQSVWGFWWDHKRKMKGDGRLLALISHSSYTKKK